MIRIANRIGSGDFPVSKPHPCKTQDHLLKLPSLYTSPLSVCYITEIALTRYQLVDPLLTDWRDFGDLTSLKLQENILVGNFQQFLPL
jgi:hypothetical protein